MSARSGRGRVVHGELGLGGKRNGAIDAPQTFSTYPPALLHSAFRHIWRCDNMAMWRAIVTKFYGRFMEH